MTLDAPLTPRPSVAVIRPLAEPGRVRAALDAIGAITLLVLLMGLAVGTLMVALDGWTSSAPLLRALPDALVASVSAPVAIILSLVVVLGGAAWVSWRLAVAWRARRAFIVSELALGRLTIDRASVVRVATLALSAAPDVLRASARVYELGDGVGFACRIRSAHTATLPVLGPELQRLIRETIESNLGLRVLEVNVRFRAERLASGHRVLR